MDQHFVAQRNQARCIDLLQECLRNVDTTRTGKIECDKLGIICQALGFDARGVRKAIQASCKRGESKVVATEFVECFQKIHVPQLKELNRMNPQVQ